MENKLLEVAAYRSQLSREAEKVAEVVRSGAVVEIRLPEDYAYDALKLFLHWHGADAKLLQGPWQIGEHTIHDGQWAVAPTPGAPLELGAVGVDLGPTRLGPNLIVYPQNTIVVKTALASHVLRAMENLKPEELDSKGRPYSWAPPKVEQEADGIDRSSNDHDAEVVEQALPEAASSEDAGETIATQNIEERFDWLCEQLGIPVPNLVVLRGDELQMGLVTGKVWHTRSFAPLRVQLTTCPNSDMPEILATMVHEIAHPCSHGTGHDRAFKEMLVDLACMVWGDDFFAGARNHLGDRTNLVDCWVATGIRAAEQGQKPPRPKTADDGQTAKLLNRLRKLRALAEDQQGLPEAIAATAQANDLITMYGLGGYQLNIDARIDHQMVDAWVVLPDRSVWRRNLAHATAKFSSVFSLAFASKGRMHFFGRHADVVAAEYLYSVSAERIARQAEAHIDAWKDTLFREGARPKGGQVRSQKTAFCDSAVLGFKEKLTQIRYGEKQFDSTTTALQRADLSSAEAFAKAEHDKRGLSWGSRRGKQVRLNEAGHAAGHRLGVTRGLDRRGKEPRKLPPSPGC